FRLPVSTGWLLGRRTCSRPWPSSERISDSDSLARWSPDPTRSWSIRWPNSNSPEFIYEQPATGDIEYTFKHPLAHDVAYNSVLIERRKALHERVAQAIEDQAANSLNDHLANLALHYGHSGNRMKAFHYLTRAGTQIVPRSTFPDAMQYFGRALDILAECRR